MSKHTLGRKQLVLPRQNFHSPMQTGKGIGGTQVQMIPNRFLKLRIHQFWIFSLLSLQRIFQGLPQVCWWALRNKKNISFCESLKEIWVHSHKLSKGLYKLCYSLWHSISLLCHFMLQKYSFTIIYWCISRCFDECLGYSLMTTQLIVSEFWLHNV